MAPAGLLKSHRWLLVIPVLLLAAMLAGRRLNSWNFSLDETYELIVVGARSFGPLSFSEVWQDLASASSPDQPFGFPLILNMSGRFVGWSTVALRALSWFAGLSALALTYLIGKRLFSHRAGLVATLLLATSVYFVSFMHVARAFAFVSLFSALTLWSYWCVALRGRCSGTGHRVALLLGGAGLLYTHYVAALLLPALGLYHVIFVRKDRRWLYTTLILLMSLLSALPEFPVLLDGTAWNISKLDPGGSMSASEVTIRLLYMLTNSLVSLPQRTGPGLALLLLFAFLLLLRRRPRHNIHHAGWYLGVVATIFYGLALTLNLAVPILISNRMRYLMPLWPTVALLAGYAIWRLGRTSRRLADLILVALLASGFALNLRSNLYLSATDYELTVVHLADQTFARQAMPDDFLLLEQEAMGQNPNIRTSVHKYYLTSWGNLRAFVSPESDPEQALQQARAHERVWLLTSESDSVVEQLLSEEMQFCRRPVERKGMALALYAQSEADCG